MQRVTAFVAIFTADTSIPALSRRPRVSASSPVHGPAAATKVMSVVEPERVVGKEAGAKKERETEGGREGGRAPRKEEEGVVQTTIPTDPRNASHK